MHSWKTVLTLIQSLSLRCSHHNTKIIWITSHFCPFHCFKKAPIMFSISLATCNLNFLRDTVLLLFMDFPPCWWKIFQRGDEAFDLIIIERAENELACIRRQHSCRTCYKYACSCSYGILGKVQSPCKLHAMRSNLSLREIDTTRGRNHSTRYNLSVNKILVTL